jgi:hypothetical protein
MLQNILINNKDSTVSFWSVKIIFMINVFANVNNHFNWRLILIDLILYFSLLTIDFLIINQEETDIMFTFSIV